MSRGKLDLVVQVRVQDGEEPVVTVQPASVYSDEVRAWARSSTTMRQRAAGLTVHYYSATILFDIEEAS